MRNPIRIEKYFFVSWMFCKALISYLAREDLTFLCITTSILRFSRSQLKVNFYRCCLTHHVHIKDSNLLNQREASAFKRLCQWSISEMFAIKKKGNQCPQTSDFKGDFKILQHFHRKTGPMYMGTVF